MVIIMDIRLVMITSRSVTFELNDGGTYETKEKYRILLNGAERGTADTVITSLFDLKPDTEYELDVRREDGTSAGSLSFRTEEEFVTINVRELGAAGDGLSDDTGFIQAAIMACPSGSRVLIPRGKYKITSIFLKSGIHLEIAKGAELLAETDRDRFAKFRHMGRKSAADVCRNHFGNRRNRCETLWRGGHQRMRFGRKLVA